MFWPVQCQVLIIIYILKSFFVLFLGFSNVVLLLKLRQPFIEFSVLCKLRSDFCSGIFFICNTWSQYLMWALLKGISFLSQTLIFYLFLFLYTKILTSKYIFLNQLWNHFVYKFLIPKLLATDQKYFSVYKMFFNFYLHQEKKLQKPI